MQAIPLDQSGKHRLWKCFIAGSRCHGQISIVYPGQPWQDEETAELWHSRATQPQVYPRLATQEKIQKVAFD